MKKLILLFIILTLTLSGCGIFDLDGWVVPDDAEFLALIQELDTPGKISSYMIENFTYKTNLLWTPDPYIFWQTKKGDCNDFATFGVFVADYHGYETFQIKIFNNTLFKHWLAVYVGDKGLSFTDNQYYNLGLPRSYRFNTFREIVEHERALRLETWSKYIVYDYSMNIVEQVTK